MSTPTDERKGKPSASGMERIALCPGSFTAELTVKTPEVPSVYAERGTRIASVVEKIISTGGHTSPWLGSEDVDDQFAVTIYNHTLKAYEAAAPHVGMFASLHAPESLIAVERRLWSVGDRFSGKPDVLVVNGKSAVIIDHKSGWGDVTEAAHNWQLRTLAVLAFQRMAVDRVAVAIVQPTAGQPTVGVFDETSLIAAQSTINDAIDRATKNNDQRLPSPKACKFCKFRPQCPEAKQVLVNLSTNTNIPTDLPLALEMIEVADMIAEDIRSQAKACLAADPKSVPGWKLRPGAVRHTVKNPAAAYAQIKDVVTPIEFTNCCTVKFGELTKVYGKATGLKGKDAKAAIVSRLGEELEEKVTSPVLCRDNAKDGGDE